MGAQTTILPELTVVGLMPDLHLLCPANSTRNDRSTACNCDTVLLCQLDQQRQAMCRMRKSMSRLFRATIFGLVATENAMFSACVRSTWKAVPNSALPSSNKLVRMGSSRLWASSHISLPGRNCFTFNTSAHMCDGLLGLI